MRVLHSRGWQLLWRRLQGQRCVLQALLQPLLFLLRVLYHCGERRKGVKRR